jgi:hypothetical protein
MARKLKTYQTSLGFFEQAIAAPSMKAALEAGGANSNLFHQGAAKKSPILMSSPRPWRNRASFSSAEQWPQLAPPMDGMAAQHDRLATPRVVRNELVYKAVSGSGAREK